MNLAFHTFFKTATGHLPYGWQERLASDSCCDSRLIDIPTGLGKTAGVVLAWLWNRSRSQSVTLKKEAQSVITWPRRLVYCLPMRTLVEQTRDEVKKWLDKLEKADLLGSKRPRVVILMGGEDPGDKDWDIYPEDPAILIGTQDMLLSRALNRGYGMSRYRWPMHFALLNNDALWVMDEVQLMGTGLETSAQLQGLRGAIGVKLPCLTWWMSATVAAERLETPDFKSDLPTTPTVKLSDEDLAQPEVQLRTSAVKTVHFSEVLLTETKAAELSEYASELAAKVAQTHETGSLTLVILNRVDRAQAVYQALQATASEIPMALIHSRFRPVDRVKHMKLLHQQAGGIVVATQAIEAGLDLSARHLFTEIAPWSSLVQRMGRCNRDGKHPDGGSVHWIDLHSPDDKKMRDLALPYTAEALKLARDELAKATDVSPQSLRKHRVAEDPVIRPILRKKDLLDLFDTTPDLAGMDLDVSRYVRDSNDTDVEVFWRAIPKDASPDGETTQPNRAEVCRVSFTAFRTFIKKAKSRRIWRWQGLTGEWETVNERSVYPGMTCVIASDLGGYAADLGWTGDPKSNVEEIPQDSRSEPPERDADDPDSFTQKEETLESHTANVVALTENLANALLPVDEALDSLVTAARWHDLGKVHYHFQTMLLGEGRIPEDGTAYLAKSAEKNRCSRPHFRHELASALAWLDLPASGEHRERDLIAYLIASHHGKVRLSIRAMPNEHGSKSDPERAFARGVWQDDPLPCTDWPAIQLNGETLPPISLDLSILALGGADSAKPSWLERALALRDRTDLGPFALAYLETLLRAADGRASQS